MNNLIVQQESFLVCSNLERKEDGLLKIGAIIQACRERAGFSQEKLAEMMNRSRSCISKFENNYKKPDVDEFIEILNHTNAKEVAVAYLCGMDGIAILSQLLPILG